MLFLWGSFKITIATDPIRIEAPNFGLVETWRRDQKSLTGIYPPTTAVPHVLAAPPRFTRIRIPYGEMQRAYVDNHWSMIESGRKPRALTARRNLRYEASKPNVCNPTQHDARNLMLHMHKSLQKKTLFVLMWNALTYHSEIFRRETSFHSIPSPATPLSNRSETSPRSRFIVNVFL